MGIPLVSVIIPCYNAEKYIDICMKSLLNQTLGFENLEVILVNDASTDGTLEKLYEYEKQYSDNIMVVNYEENRKQGYARNLGIQYSRAKYITFLDVDDYVASDMTEKMYRKMEEGNYDYVICNYYRVIHGKPMIMEEDAQEEELCYEINSEEKRKKFLVTDTPFKGSCGTFYKREFLVEHNIFYPSDTFYEDLFWLGLLRFYAKKVCVIPDRLYYYVNWDNASVVTKPNSTHQFERLYVMELFLEEVKKRGLYEKYKWEAEMYFLQLYYINSVSFFAMHFEHCPLQILHKMRETVLEKVPDYASNPYIKNCFPFEQTILKFIELNPKTKEQWDEIFKAIRESVTEG